MDGSLVTNKIISKRFSPTFGGPGEKSVFVWKSKWRLFHILEGTDCDNIFHHISTFDNIITIYNNNIVTRIMKIANIVKILQNILTIWCTLYFNILSNLTTLLTIL